MVKSPSTASSQFKATSISSPKPNKPNKIITQSPPNSKHLLSVQSDQGSNSKLKPSEKIALNKLNNHSAYQEVEDTSASELSTPHNGKITTHRESLETKNAKSVPISALKSTVSTLPSPRELKSAETLLGKKQVTTAANIALNSKQKNRSLKSKINIDTSHLKDGRDQERGLF